MKKVTGFFIFVIILAGLGAAIFLAGWAQLNVPPGSVAVMRSKTHGIDSGIIREGEFRWIWYKLIPTNVTITVFSPRIMERPLQITGNLPSGAVYRTFAALDTSFSYEITGTFSFSVTAAALPGLMEMRNLAGQEDLLALENRLAGEIDAFIGQRLAVYAEGEEELEALLNTGSPASLEAEIAAQFPEVERVRVTLRAVEYPDFSLYRTSKQLYEDFLAYQRQILTAPLSERAGRRVETRLRMEELARYGELLTKYPVLLQYLSIERNDAGN
jgi:hypothetical protein